MENITYEEFIENILNTRGRFGCGEEYHERHHILPTCLGGNNDKDNLIDLFAREHFMAHKLLSEENPNNDKLTYAYWMMAHIGRVEVTEEEYEKARIACSKAFSEARQGWYMGENNPNYGNYWTEEQKQHMREVKRSIPQDIRDKMSTSQKQRLSAPENNPMYGKHHSEEAKQKIGEASRNRKREVYQKMSQKAKERYKNINSSSFNPVLRLTLDDILVDVFYTASQVEDELHICSIYICQCCNGKQKSAGGYHWKRLYDHQLKDKTIPGAISLGLITEEEALKQLEQDKLKNETK